MKMSPMMNRLTELKKKGKFRKGKKGFLAFGNKGGFSAERSGKAGGSMSGMAM